MLRRRGPSLLGAKPVNISGIPGSASADYLMLLNAAAWVLQPWPAAGREPIVELAHWILAII